MEAKSEFSANAAIATSVAGVLTAPFQESPFRISTTNLSTCTVTKNPFTPFLLHSRNLSLSLPHSGICNMLGKVAEVCAIIPQTQLRTCVVHGHRGICLFCCVT